MTTATHADHSHEGYDWGIFTAEGMVEGRVSHTYAEVKAARLRENDETIYIDRECADHEEQPKTTCEDCATDGDESADDDSDN